MVLRAGEEGEAEIRTSLPRTIPEEGTECHGHAQEEVCCVLKEEGQRAPQGKQHLIWSLERWNGQGQRRVL